MQSAPPCMQAARPDCMRALRRKTQTQQEEGKGGREEGGRGGRGEGGADQGSVELVLASVGRAAGKMRRNARPRLPEARVRFHELHLLLHGPLPVLHVRAARQHLVGRTAHPPPCGQGGMSRNLACGTQRRKHAMRLFSGTEPYESALCTACTACTAQLRKTRCAAARCRSCLTHAVTLCRPRRLSGWLGGRGG